jgi:hypothetical protein
MSCEIEGFELGSQAFFEIFFSVELLRFLAFFFLPNVVEDPGGRYQVGLAERTADPIPNDLPKEKPMTSSKIANVLRIYNIGSNNHFCNVLV